jgi:deoxyribose-phosphate aldolase
MASNGTPRKASRFREADSDGLAPTSAPPLSSESQRPPQSATQPPAKPLPQIPPTKAPPPSSSTPQPNRGPAPGTQPQTDPAAHPAPDRQKLLISLPKLASYIDHHLLDPALTDSAIASGLALAQAHHVAAVVVKPYSVAQARRTLALIPTPTSSSTPASTPTSPSSSSSSSSPTRRAIHLTSVAGFPHGSSTTTTKLLEARAAIAAGATAIEAVANAGQVRSHAWPSVRDELAALQAAVTGSVVGSDVDWHAADPSRRRTARLAVVLEGAWLGDGEVVRLCEVCAQVGVAFVVAGTGFGADAREGQGQGGGRRAGWEGGMLPLLRLMAAHVGPGVQVKAAGGVDTLDRVLDAIAAGATRVGTTATEAILREARERGIGDDEVEVEVGYDDADGEEIHKQSKRWSTA